MLYVAGEILLWMALAFALGLLLGWFVWGLRQRKAIPAAQAALRPAVPSEVESVTVRPVPKSAPVTTEVAADLPVTPPAGQPAVPLAPPIGGPVGTPPPAAGEAEAELSLEEPVPVQEPLDEAVPDDEPAASAGLAALVADEPFAADDPGATPAGGQPAVAAVDTLVAEPVVGVPETVAPAPAEDVDAPGFAPVDRPTEVIAPVPAGPDLTEGERAMGKPLAVDDLKVVEGIGPRIEAVLHESGVVTWSDLADASPERLRTLLDLAGDQFRIHDPATWPRQADLAVQGRWDELLQLQATLAGGKDA